MIVIMNYYCANAYTNYFFPLLSIYIYLNLHLHFRFGIPLLSSMLFSTLLSSLMLFCTLLRSSTLFCTLLRSFVPFSTLQHSSVFFCTLLHSSALFCVLLCSSSLFSTLLHSSAVSSASHCLYSFLDSKKQATSNLPFQVLEGFIWTKNKNIFSILESPFLGNPLFVPFPA